MAVGLDEVTNSIDCYMAMLRSSAGPQSRFDEIVHECYQLTETEWRIYAPEN